MNLDNLTQNSGEWLRGTGPGGGHRHLQPHPPGPQPGRLPLHQPRHARSEGRDRDARCATASPSSTSAATSPTSTCRVPQQPRPPVPRRAPAHQPRAGHRRRAARRRHRAAARPSASWSTRRTTSASRSCAAASPSTRPGRRSTASTTSLEQRVTYAFSEEFGYLTACPTNVGTGMRASVMLHLPALVLTKQIEKVFRALQKINLAVRGLYGEGSRASGDFYQISNQVTLGKSEADHPQRDPRGHPADHRLRAQGPRDAGPREPQRSARPASRRAYGTLRSAHDDDLRRDDGPALQRPPGHQPAA